MEMLLFKTKIPVSEEIQDDENVEFLEICVFL